MQISRDHMHDYIGSGCMAQQAQQAPHL